jgi:hypothetical protein
VSIPTSAFVPAREMGHSINRKWNFCVCAY